MKNCFFRNELCQNCDLNRLYKKYFFLIDSDDCHYVFGRIASYLKNILLRTPNSIYHADAYELIDIVKHRVDNNNLLIAIQLGTAAIQSRLFMGLNKKRSMEAGNLLSRLELYLDKYCCMSTETEFASVYCDFYSIKFQLIHLTGKYSLVTKEYENRLASDDVILQYGDRVISQYTASKWVGSSSKHERRESRDVAEALMSDISLRSSFSASHYFIAAKYLEHHIQSKTPSDGLKEISKMKILSQPSDVTDILFSNEATNQAILYRDIYEAAIKSGVDESVARPYLIRAKEIADVFYLRDQRKKIRKVEKKLGSEMNDTKRQDTAPQTFTFYGGNQQIISNPTESDITMHISPSNADKELWDRIQKVFRSVIFAGRRFAEITG